MTGPGRAATGARRPPRPGRRRALACLAALVLAAPAVGLERPPRIRELQLEGCQHLRPRRVRAAMQSRPRLWRKPEYRPRQLGADLEAVLALYASEGYLDARIAAREVTLSADGRRARIRVAIEEGPRTRVGEVSVEGAEQITADEIRSQLRVHEGAPFRTRLLFQDRTRAQRLYAERGMIGTRIEYRAVVDSSAVATVSYRIAEGPPVRVGRLVLEGLEKTRPHIVRRELKLWPGDLYRYSALQRSQTGVFSTGLFRSVVVEPVPADSSGEPGARDLRVAVRERPAGALDAGLGYGTSEGFRTVVSVSQSNWLGRALRLGASARASRLVRRAEAAFTNPRLLGNPFALDCRTFYAWERNPEAGFRTQRVGTESVLSYSLLNRWVGEGSYRLEEVELLQEDVRLAQPALTTSLLGVGARRDTRDDALDPRTGHLVRLRLEYAGGWLRGDNDFRRVSAELLHFQTAGPAVLAVHLQGSQIVAADTAEVVQYERFYLGGDRSVRGYGRGEIGADRVGHLALSWQLEARLLTGAHAWVLFLDSGQVWQRAREVSRRDLRYGYGAGFRYSSRFGLLRLDAALAHRDVALVHRLSVYFGVGQAF
ncbi:MAG: BamA/TamA family outer membrane protein [Gemmatimonadota bacterium]